MTEAEQFERLRTWLLRVTELPEIILAHQSAPRPVGPYGLLNLIRADRVNWPDDYAYELNAGSSEEPALEIPILTWEWVWSFNVYAAGAADWAGRVVTASRSPAALLRLHPLTLQATSAIRRLPELIGERWEDRVQIDLSVRGLARDGVPVDLVEKTSVSMGPSDRGTLATVTVTKP